MLINLLDKSFRLNSDSHIVVKTLSHQWPKILILFCSIIVVLSLGFLIGSANRRSLPYSDEATYMVVAKSISEGTGVRLISHPEAPPAVLNPPSYSILLAGLINFFGLSSPVPYRYLTFLFWGVSLAVLCFIVYQRDGQKWAFLVVILVGVNIYLIDYSSRILTEIPYLAVSLILIALVYRYSEERNKLEQYLLVCLIVLVGTYLLYLRFVGISLVAAIVTYLIISRRSWKIALIIGAFIGLGFFPWLVWSRISGGHSNIGFLTVADPYNHDLTGPLLDTLFNRFTTNMYYYVFSPDPAVIRQLIFAENYLWAIPTFQSHYINTFLTITVLLIILLGWKTKFSSKSLSIGQAVPLVELYVLFYLLILFMWPFQDQRFLLPALPFLVWYFITGLVVLITFLTNRLNWSEQVRRRLILSACAIFLGFTLTGSITYVKASFDVLLEGRISHNPDRNDYFEAGVWLKDNTVSEAVIVARKPDSLYLVMDRYALRYPFTANQTTMACFFLKHNVSYVVLDNFGKKDSKLFLDPFLKNNKDAFKEVFKTRRGTTRVLQAEPELLIKDDEMNLECEI